MLKIGRVPLVEIGRVPLVEIGRVPLAEVRLPHENETRDLSHRSKKSEEDHVMCMCVPIVGS